MAVKWQNCVDIDFGVQFPRLSMRAVHGFVRSLKVEPQDVLGLVAVLEKRNQVARITFTTKAYTRSFLSKHSGIVRTELEGKEVNVVIRDSNIEERFVRIAGIPQNLDLGRRQILFNFCRDGNFDVLGLQEVAFHSCPIIESCYHFLSNVGPNKNGTAFLVKHGLDHSRLLDPDGRLMSIDLNSFTVINIYAPSGKQAKEERNNFLRRTIPAYASTTRLPLVLIGDFNCVDDIQDRKQTKSQSCHTFHHHGGSSRLDRIYASKAFADNFRSICLQHLSISDHQSIQSSFTCNLNIPHLAKSTVGLWKMNVLILLEEGFQRTVIDFIEQCSSHPLRLSNVANWWESVLKPGIRRIAIAYCKQRAKRIRETKLFYQSCMQCPKQTPLIGLPFKS
ncbi:hypothetical protein GHT06_018573 [Daphnia sinensis]|uniref:exodeoxyribonuclease III n=1 Tax=Daphnia sinensis TaxID=1820382 RepID=A0AAD5KNZ6_9CRUS|nr:hypothetical protein GHT06_018573 [Daphnia sinensis]